jgi:hypothetical protein
MRSRRLAIEHNITSWRRANSITGTLGLPVYHFV